MTKLGHWTDRLLRKPAQTFRNEENMQRYGIRNIMRAAKLYNRWRYHDRAKRHDNAYKTHLDQLLIENAGPGFGQHRKIELNDGWALDTSGQALDVGGAFTQFQYSTDFFRRFAEFSAPALDYPPVVQKPALHRDEPGGGGDCGVRPPVVHKPSLHRGELGQTPRARGLLHAPGGL